MDASWWQARRIQASWEAGGGVAASARSDSQVAPCLIVRRGDVHYASEWRQGVAQPGRGLRGAH